MNKKTILSLILALALLLGTTLPILAVQPATKQVAGYVTISADANTLGLGYLFPPQRVAFYTDENYAQVTDRFLGGSSNYKMTGSLEQSFYLSRLRLLTSRPLAVPPEVLEMMGTTQEQLVAQGSNEAGYLGERDYDNMSGWKITINNEFPSMGAADEFPQNGDVCRWQFTLYGFGSDLDQQADRDGATVQIAQVNSAANKDALLASGEVEKSYNEAVQTAEQFGASAQALEAAQKGLAKALADFAAPTPPPAPPSTGLDITEQLNASFAYLLSTVSQPAVGSTGGEWAMIALRQGGQAVPTGYYEGYYQRVLQTLEEAKGVLTTSAYSDYSRLILSLTALGKNPQNVAGYNLLEPIARMDQTTKQGINGAVFALIAYDSNNYDIPAQSVTEQQVTREKLLQYILNKEVQKGTDNAGGFTLIGSAADPDITGMVLQALAPYQDRADVAPAVQRALTALSKLQLPTGGFSTWNSETAESSAQMIIALTSLGIDPATDSRFVKEGNNPVQAMLRFAKPEGGFAHLLAANAKVNAMATEQCTLAMVAYQRLLEGKSPLYKMTAQEQAPDAPSKGLALTLEMPENIGSLPGTTIHAVVKTQGYPEGEFKLLDGVINVPSCFTVTAVTEGEAFTGGGLAWNYAKSEQKLRVVYTNTQLKNIQLDTETFPATLLTIQLELAAGFDPEAIQQATLSVGGLSLKGEAQEKAPVIFDNAKAVATVRFSGGISIRALYSGDGIDLIAQDKKAVLVSIPTAAAATEVLYRDKAIYYSPELSAKWGVSSYLMLVDAKETTVELTKSANYQLGQKSGAHILLGDTDGTGTLNAQDALDIILAWLRKTPISTDQQILAFNVTGDARINTYDALAVMESYVSGTALPILV